MAATTTAEIKITTGFADNTTRSLALGPFAVNAAAIANAKTNIKAFNPETVKNIYLSDSGATCTGIAAGTVVVVEEEEINLNG